MSSSNPPTLDEWPREVRDLYDPIRVIGKGGFASVWMANKREPHHHIDEDQVAIKIMKDDECAEREVAILSELSSKHPHPAVVRLICDFKAENGQVSKNDGIRPGIRYAVLSLARGPTLNFILNEFGALGIVVAQRISRQLIDAVAFLHSHAGEMLLC
jgi:serine/threonine protein kinase